MNTPTTLAVKPVQPTRDRYEKLLIAVVSGMFGVCIGGVLLYCFNTIGVLIAILATVLTVLFVPVVVRMR